MNKKKNSSGASVTMHSLYYDIFRCFMFKLRTCPMNRANSTRCRFHDSSNIVCWVACTWGVGELCTKNCVLSLTHIMIKVARFSFAFPSFEISFIYALVSFHACAQSGHRFLHNLDTTGNHIIAQNPQEKKKGFQLLFMLITATKYIYIYMYACKITYCFSWILWTSRFLVDL